MSFKKFISNIYVINGLLAIGVVILLIFLLMQWLDVYTKHGQQVTVPSVKGMQVDAAAPLLQRQGLDYLVVDSIFIRNHKAGSIYETTPPAGTHVKPGRTIYLTINAGTADLVTVPSVIDMSQRQAMAMLTSQGFSNIQVKYVSGVYKDLVTGLENRNGRKIAAGTQLTANTSLVLLVVSGDGEEEEDVEIPTETSDDSWF
jgi:beta-lactam-binding protein with PASTA domain